MQFWSKGDSVIGSVEVSPLLLTAAETKGQARLVLRQSCPWQVGGVVYPSWREAYTSALRPLGRTDVVSVPSPSVYFGPRVRSRRLERVYGTDVSSVWDVIREVELARAAHIGVQSAQRAPTVSGSVGIDLERRGHEVRKLFFAGFGHRIKKHGYDPEEVLQEVYQGLLVRNRGKCPFDPAKSSFGHYVHMVAECIINNYHRKHNRRRMNEVAALDLVSGSMGSGLSSSSEGLTESGVLDRAASLVAEDAGAGLAQSLVAGRIRLMVNEGVISRRQAQFAVEVLPYLASDPSLGRSCPRVGDLAVIGWRYGQPEWRTGVSALRVVMEGA